MATNDLLNVGSSLVHVVEVDVGRVLPGSSLPESECVDEDNISRAEDGVGGAVSELVPAVGGSDLDALRKSLLDSLDLALELLAREVAAVERLGADGDGVDDVLELVGDLLDGVQVVVEGFLDIGPVQKRLVATNTSSRCGNRTRCRA